MDSPTWLQLRWATLWAGALRQQDRGGSPTHAVSIVPNTATASPAVRWAIELTKDVIEPAFADARHPILARKWLSFALMAPALGKRPPPQVFMEAQERNGTSWPYPTPADRGPGEMFDLDRGAGWEELAENACERQHQRLPPLSKGSERRAHRTADPPQHWSGFARREPRP